MPCHQIRKTETAMSKIVTLWNCVVEDRRNNNAGDKQMTNTTPRKRRSHWQALAHSKYRRMLYLDGDGDWVVMTKCPPLNCDHRSWAYRLFGEQLDAEVYLARINQHGCNATSGDKRCFGSVQHSIWRLIDTHASAPPATHSNPISVTIVLPSDCQPKDVNWFE